MYDDTMSHDDGWLTRGVTEGSMSTSCHALVVLWSLSEPQRVGDICLLPMDGQTRLLGRGSPQSSDEHLRVSWHRQRPSGQQPSGPLSAKGLSRRQLRLTSTQQGVVCVPEKACRLWHNGQEVERASLAAYDTLRINNQLVLMCVPRQLPMLKRTPEYLGEAFDFGAPDSSGIVGESFAVWQLRCCLATAASSDEHVLVTGPSGSGKELAARAIHFASRRSRAAFVARNASTLPDTLIDAELFGNAKNYPNVGSPEREGLVGAAHGGTLFLDEVGELSHQSQTHLLRVLDSGGEYQRLGETSARISKFRMIGATNRPASALRADFLARFTWRIEVPGLRERQEDIPVIARHVARRLCQEHPRLGSRFLDEAGSPRFAPEFVEQLVRRRFATNVRELRAVLLRSIERSSYDYLESMPPAAEDVLTTSSQERGARPAVSSALVLQDKERLKNALLAADDNLALLARQLGTSRSHVYRYVERYGLDRNKHRR